ncbi:hypothetical protein [Streptomyces fradiae]|uniref:hypothetical protein n=2 Tax=Streptomyces fradiae TaxID=1906 RepID=UPI00123CDBE8|nr:hypothetical protein [Streptomyces fradiae]QEV11659.1 hypothetical protein CP974_06115 [Streptomyces fradiae ATCC 10745 = DSM 40063]QEV12045.1 hypothetical protein CP974_08455 [Streptomyces fradiae ATCC 10745 = DSM 40063]
MTDTTDHIQHTWNLTHPTGDRVTIDLWTDGYSVRVDGGNSESTEGGRQDVEKLLERYALRGYWVESDYPVNDPAAHDDDTDPDEPADKPDACPECGAPVEHASNHVADHRQGDAWLCTGCRWGEWI